MTQLTLELIAEALSDKFDVSRFQALLQRVVQDKNDRAIVVSHELFMMPWLDDAELLQRFREHLALFNLTIPENLDGEAMCRNISAAVPGCKIILIIRNQFKVMFSEYVHRVREDIKPWSNLNTISRFYNETYHSKEYHRIIETLFGSFGAKQVLVLPFEWLKTDQKGFVSRLEQFTGKQFDVSNLEAENKGEYAMVPLMTKKYESRIRDLKNKNFLINQRVSNFLYYRFISKKATMAGIKKVLGWRYGNRDIAIPAQIQHRFDKVFAASNHRTAELTGLDLKSAGYAF